MSDAHSHDHDACAQALQHLQTFLHSELCEADADSIRAHLVACESCQDEFDLENTITALLRRAHPPVRASGALRMRVSSFSVTIRRTES